LGLFFASPVVTYLTIGDVEALSNIEYSVCTVAQRNTKVGVRFVNDLCYGDLRQDPTILIGACGQIFFCAHRKRNEKSA